ncbi:MAG: hypothetical protein ACRQFF_05200 [Sphaerochaeta sp.]
MKKLIILFLTFFVITSSVFASYPETDVQKIYDTESYRDFVYFMYDSPTESNLSDEVRSITDFIDSSDFDEDAKIISKSQVFQIVGEYLIKTKTTLNDKNGKVFTEDGLDEIGKISNLNKNEEALIVKADLLGNYIMLGSSYIFSKGIESSKVLDKALKLNKENPRSILIDSEKKIYAPGLFGGDKEKAKQQLKELIGNYELLPKDAFEAVRNLGIIAAKEGKDDFAATYYSYATNIFPNNLDVIKLKAEL